MVCTREPFQLGRRRGFRTLVAISVQCVDSLDQSYNSCLYAIIQPHSEDFVVPGAVMVSAAVDVVVMQALASLVRQPIFALALS